MTSLSPNRATTIKEAYRICNVVPLEGEDFNRYYVSLDKLRKGEAAEGVSTQLDFLEAGQFETILFTGHRGSGKSTELKRLQSRWQETFEVIYLEVNEETDINDVQYTDIYLVVIKQIEFRMRQLGLTFEASLLRNFENWFKEVTEESEETVENSVSVQAEASLGGGASFLAKLLVKLQAQIKGSEKQKKTIRHKLQREISRLKGDTNLLLDDAFEKLRALKPEFKGFLLIFDNLDRVPPNVGDHLFFDYAQQLRELHCTMVFTVPISVLCSPKGLGNTFEYPNLMSMPNVYALDRDSLDLKYNDDAVAKLAKLLESRIDIEAVFDDRERILELARYSGGHVRQMMQMARLACQTAGTRRVEKVGADEVLYAFKQQQFMFERAVREGHYERLVEVCRDKDVGRDEIGQLMLFNTSVLEYNGEDRWNYPNPAVMASPAFQELLDDARDEARKIVEG
ncbi:MAG: ATP-binding protein [Geitlerinemataceae cyanobacterium]